MDTSVAVLVDAKREYTKQLIQAILPYLLSGVLSIYDEAFNVCQENKETDLTMLTFQELLGEVPKWNNVMIVDETERIINDSKCDYLEDLLTAVFVCHTKILTTVRVTNKDRKINLKIPCVENFVHQVYIEMAREFWKHPYLLNPLDVSKLEYQQNLKKSEILIHDCLESTIRKLLPVKDILKEYLVEDNLSDEEGDDLDSSRDLSTDLIGGGGKYDKETKTNLNLEKDKPSSEKKECLQQRLSSLTKDTDMTFEKKENVKNNASASTNTKVPEKSVFNAMLDAIEGKTDAIPSASKSADIKTVSTSGAKSGGSSFIGGGSSLPTSTVDSTKKLNISTPTLSLNANPNTSSPTSTATSNALSSPITPLSLSSLTCGGSISPISPKGNSSTSSEISLDNLGAIEEVKVDFGRPSSPTPSIQSDVLSEFDKMTKSGSSPSSSPISSPTSSDSSNKPFTFF